MSRSCVSLLAAVMMASLVAVACTQAAPAPTATKPAAAPATAAPTKPAAAPATAAPTKPAAAPATAAPAKVDFPAKGQTITFIIGAGAGGSMTTMIELLKPGLEKELGTNITVQYTPTGAWSVGLNNLAKAKPDGYTMGYTPIPTSVTAYMDPERAAPFNRKSFQALAVHTFDGGAVAVRADSPWKDLKDWFDAAKASPGQETYGVTGFMTAAHMAHSLMQKQHGVQFRDVLFDAVPQMLAALVGGHVNAIGTYVPDALGWYKAGQVRLLGVSADQQSPHYPGVKTFKEQGYPVFFSTVRGISVPAGTPKGIVDLLHRAIVKAAEAPEHKTKIEALGFTVKTMTIEEYEKYWSETEAVVEEVLKVVRR